MNKDFEKTVISSTAVAGGAMIGKVLSAKIPDNKLPGGKMSKHSLLMVLGIAGIYSLNRKDSTQAFGLDACIGLASSQMLEMAASLLGDKAKKLGLSGTYFDEDDVIYLDDYSLNGLSDDDLLDEDLPYDEDELTDYFMSGNVVDEDEVDFM